MRESHSNTMKLIMAASVIGIVTSPPAPAMAGPSVRLGVLTCDVSQGISHFVTRKETLSCTFQPDGSAPAVNYTGVIEQYGLELGKVEQGRLVWTVAALARDKAFSSLAGKYVGADASVAVGVGLGANALVGGIDEALALQPLSVEGETGVNFAAGVETVTLQIVN